MWFFSKASSKNQLASAKQQQQQQQQQQFPSVHFYSFHEFRLSLPQSLLIQPFSILLSSPNSQLKIEGLTKLQPISASYNEHTPLEAIPDEIYKISISMVRLNQAAAAATNPQTAVPRWVETANSGRHARRNRQPQGFVHQLVALDPQQHSCA